VTLLGFVGDVVVDRDEPDSVFDDVVDVLGVPDVLFGNCEAAYTDAPQIGPTTVYIVSPGAANLPALRRFHVVSLATNHIADAGLAALLETRARLRELGVATAGAGGDLEEARRPAVVERNGIRVAYVSTCSVFPMGYEAGAAKAGLAPLRATTHHRDGLPGYWAPGIPGTIVSVPLEEDLDALCGDLARARSGADVVVASFHWGDFQRPYVLTDHERQLAHFAVDHGADVVVGHHHHTLRGIEWYGGKPIFYGLGHFVLDLDARWSFDAEGRDAAASYDMYERPGWPRLPMHPDSRLTMLAWVELDGAAPAAAGFVACSLTPDGRVHAHDARSETGRAVAAYVERACREERLEVAVAPADEPAFAGLAPFRVTSGV
jgi:poly-gamma-glutamate synthesis protein (capsule biosynthesis protein)